MTTAAPPPRHAERWDETVDVLVVGYGLAGGVAALHAHDAGATVRVVEKNAVPGGLSICSYGAVRSARSADDAFAYLQATNAGRTPDDVLRALAEGMAGIEATVRDLARINGARVRSSIEDAGDAARANDPFRRRLSANYPLPGTDTFYHTSVEEVPGFDARAEYPWANGAPGGPRLFRVLDDHLRQRAIEVRLSTPAVRLVTAHGSREVTGATVLRDGRPHRIRARRGVVLACGGFEASEEMKRQHWEAMPVFNAAARTNEGDGVRMAQDCGAALWHMWHFHGSYGFRHTDPAYPYAIRTKRSPDWFPGEADRVRMKMAWVLVDQDGRRFMNEYHPYTQDTGARPLAHYDPVTQRFPRNPCFLVCDEAGRRLYPLGRPTSNDVGVRYDWSDDNLREVELGILARARTLAGLAAALGLPAPSLEATIARWNAQVARGRDDDHGRPGPSLVPIAEPPFYGARIWPVVSNTQGGPVHDARQRVLDVYGEPVPRLYAAGELGSSFGHLYLSGGNIAECFVTGRIAGREAAGLAPG